MEPMRGQTIINHKYGTSKRKQMRKKVLLVESPEKLAG